MKLLSPLQLILIMLHGLDKTALDDLQIQQRLIMTADWIKLAYAKSNDGGISKGYSVLRGHWSPSYPETTGYTITSLLNLAAWLNKPEIEELAISLANYLLDTATSEGGVAHWQAGEKPYPIVFDTGQVMFGWLAAFEATRDERYLQAAIRAGDWLVSIQDKSGSWKKYQHLGVEKVIDTRVAWALLRLYQHTQNNIFRQTAINNLDWAIEQQDTDGWFRHCAFRVEDDPFTHTLAYTAEGLFECGQILQEERYIWASQLTADALLDRQYDDGRLASTYGSGWRETSRSSCLTGNCQMARLWLCLYKVRGNEAYRTAATKAITFVARTQNAQTNNPAIRGGIAGSYPIYGIYERFSYPNWAAKFYIDALLALESTKNKKDLLVYVG